MALQAPFVASVHTPIYYGTLHYFLMVPCHVDFHSLQSCSWYLHPEGKVDDAGVSLKNLVLVSA
jgi:hypothetical protein